MSKKISYEAKIKSRNISDFDISTDELRQKKAIFHEIKHLKADLLQLEAKQRIKLESVKKTYSEIKEVKHKLKVWTDKIEGFSNV